MNANHKVKTQSNPGLQDLLSLPTEAAPEFTNWYPGKATSPVNPGNKNEGPMLSEVELRLLRAIVDQPGQPSGVYPKTARMGPQKALTIRQRLIELGYVRTHSVSCGRRGRAAVILEPLQPAIALIAKVRGMEDQP